MPGSASAGASIAELSAAPVDDDSHAWRRRRSIADRYRPAVRRASG
jgi:hypothetical protein